MLCYPLRNLITYSAVSVRVINILYEGVLLKILLHHIGKFYLNGVYYIYIKFNLGEGVE